MNFLRSARSIAARATENNRNRILADILSQRSKETVNWQVQPSCLLLLMQNQSPIGNRKVFFWRDQIDFIGGKFDPIGHTMNRHPGMTSKQFVHQAFEVRRKMLNNNESHACIGRHISKELFNRLQPTSRSANPNNELGFDLTHLYIPSLSSKRLNTKTPARISRATMNLCWASIYREKKPFGPDEERHHTNYGGW